MTTARATGREVHSPIPTGVRDVLPEEMAELRAIVEPMRAELIDSGYGEIHTPAIEFEEVMDRGDVRSTEPGFKLFDEHGRTLVLRSDMTIPTARVVATRFAETDPGPFELFYVAHVYRGVRAQIGQPREFLQIGAELIGPPGPAGGVELLKVLARALIAGGLSEFRIRVGDSSAFRTLLEHYDVPAEPRAQLLHELVTRDFVGLRREVDALCADGRLTPDAGQVLVRVAQLRGDPDLLDTLPANVRSMMSTLDAIVDGADEPLRSRLELDLGLLPRLGYYTGEVFEVYHPAVGVPLGGGGRYDDLLARFGRDLPAAGFGLTVERIHLAWRGEREA